MNPLTDGSIFAKKTDSELAYWLAEDAKKVDGHPGMNNVAASLRQAAFRLDPSATPWLPVEGSDR